MVSNKSEGKSVVENLTNLNLKSKNIGQISTKQAIKDIDKYSPMMQRYIEKKAEYLDCILFYRLGDFYEMFFDDAINVSRELELTLTGKECGLDERAPMCGIPYHAGENYATKLIDKGYKVAICEQLEDPKQTKDIVKRDVVKVMTPGTITDGMFLDERKNNYIMSIYKDGIYFGIAICDISTGEFYSTEIKQDNNFQKLVDEISRYNPSEVIINNIMNNSEEELFTLKKRFTALFTADNDFVLDNSDEITLFNMGKVDEVVENDFVPDLFNSKSLNKNKDKVFNVDTLKNTFDFIDENNNEYKKIDDKPLCMAAILLLLKYIEDTQKTKAENLNLVTIYEINKYMSLDINTRRNLELTEKMRDKSKRGTLLWVLDKTSTSMGGRMLRRWINNPLINAEEINDRLDAITELKDNVILNDDLKTILNNVYDIERLAGKIAYGTANARDLVSLKNSISQLPYLKEALKPCKSNLLNYYYKNLKTNDEICQLIEKAIVDDPPITIKEGGLIKKGYNSDIDELIELTTNGKGLLVALESKEREATGIKNLKISYNKVFGYYIEVSKSNVSQVPERYIRKQTLTTGERYITDELKDLENKIIGSQERIVQLEYMEFVKIREEIEKKIKDLQESASIIANIDVISSMADVANENNYVRPEVNDSDVIDIKGGRHPVIEKMIEANSFVENDSYLDSNEHRLNIITGPNMAGKSTYMRQVALITLMAQIGSFVPAESAEIGIVDKIFTRIGASDDLAMGESTFMVEMKEVATILKNTTDKSLVIFDEIGRGTSTYDGLSIAMSVCEYISKLHTKTLFATHYHELVKLEQTLEGTKNYHVTVKEKGEDITFLRKVIEGGTDESYGIHVARLAGVPREVTARANQILKKLEKKSIIKEEGLSNSDINEDYENQESLYNYKLSAIAQELDKVKIEELRPIDALNILQKMKEDIL